MSILILGVLATLCPGPDNRAKGPRLARFVQPCPNFLVQTSLSKLPCLDSLALPPLPMGCRPCHAAARSLAAASCRINLRGRHRNFFARKAHPLDSVPSGWMHRLSSSACIALHCYPPLHLCPAPPGPRPLLLGTPYCCSLPPTWHLRHKVFIQSVPLALIPFLHQHTPSVFWFRAPHFEYVR
jgi:hypothetical protein